MSVGETGPFTRDGLLRYFVDAAKPRQEWRVGMEVEREVPAQHGADAVPMQDGADACEVPVQDNACPAVAPAHTPTPRPPESYPQLPHPMEARPAERLTTCPAI